jgi:hypothetical protein
LPFTTDQFFGVFASYNRAFVVVVVALWLASIGTIAFVSRDPGRRTLLAYPLNALIIEEGGPAKLWDFLSSHGLRQAGEASERRLCSCQPDSLS